MIQGYKTICSKIFKSSSWAFVQKPGCTLEHCTTVLRVAVSHLNLEGKSKSEIVEPVFLPSQIAIKASRFFSSSSMSKSGFKAIILFLSIKNIPFRKRCGLQYKITPTLINSSRSTLGTTLIIAYSNKCCSCIFNGFKKVIGVV